MEVERVEYSFLVRVFPSDEWEQFEIRLKHRDASSDMGVISLTDIRAYIAKILGPEIDGTENISYNVNVLRDVDPKTGIALKDIEKFAAYTNYVDPNATRKLYTALNKRPTLPSMNVTLRLFTKNRIFIMPAPRDIAQRFYKIPHLPSIDYEITVFNGSKEQENQLLTFVEDVRADARRIATPPELIEPVSWLELIKPDRIVFVARRGEKIIGYCACGILPYRTEIRALIERNIDYFIENNKDLKARYFMGVRPKDLYEIEGLSAHSRERGKNIGRVLLFHALRFIKEPGVRRFYPVSHATTQAASYITKYFLMKPYGFRYHGPNEFMNQSFVETLSEKTKETLLRVIEQTITYYNSILEDGKDMQTLGMLLCQTASTDETVKEAIREMFVTVIHTYQLYYLLFIEGGASTILMQQTSQKILQLLSKLFGNTAKLASAVRTNKTLVEYFEENRRHIDLYSKDSSLQRGLREDIYTKTTGLYEKYDKTGLAPELIEKESMPNRLENQFREYGFLQYEPDTTKAKIIYSQAYDIVYRAVNNMAKINMLLSQRERNVPSENVFDCVNELVLVDLNKDYDYESRSDQLLEINKELVHITNDKTLRTRLKVIGDTRKAIKAKLSLIKKNRSLNATLSISIYNIPAALTAGFDMYVSHRELVKNWPLVETSILERITPSGLPIPLVITPATPPMPLDRETLFRDINTLRPIVQFQANNETLVTFKEAKYSVGVLRKHFVTLMGMRDTLDFICPLGDMEPVISLEPTTRYTAAEFMYAEDPLGEEFFQDNVMNNAII